MGIAIATNFTYIMNYLFQIVYLNLSSNTRRCITKFEDDIFDGIGNYIKIGVPTTLMIVFDMWCFYLLTLISNYIGIHENAG